MQRPDSLPIEAALAARVSARTLGPFYTLALALLDEAPFHLRHHAEHGQHDVAHLAPGRHVRVEHGDVGAPLLGLVNEVEHVAGVTPEAVEAGDHEFVAGAQERQNGRQLGPAIA